MGSALRHGRWAGALCWTAGWLAAIPIGSTATAQQLGLERSAPASGEQAAALRSVPPLESIVPGWRVTGTPWVKRSALFRTRLAGVDLALASTRFRVGRQGVSAGFPYLGRLQRVAVSLPVGQGLHLRTNIQYTRLRRSFAMTGVTGLARSTRSMVAGLGLMSAAGPTIGLGYVQIGRLGRTTPMDRAVQLLAGAPPAGRGFRLAVADGQAMRPGRVGWSLSMAAIRRAPISFAEDTPDTVIDHRAEFRLRLAF